MGEAACEEASVHPRAVGSGVTHQSAAGLGLTEPTEQAHANRALARRAAKPGRSWRPGREEAAATGDKYEANDHRPQVGGRVRRFVSDLQF